MCNFQSSFSFFSLSIRGIYLLQPPNSPNATSVGCIMIGVTSIAKFMQYYIYIISLSVIQFCTEHLHNSLLTISSFLLSFNCIHWWLPFVNCCRHASNKIVCIKLNVLYAVGLYMYLMKFREQSIPEREFGVTWSNIGGVHLSDNKAFV